MFVKGFRKPKMFSEVFLVQFVYAVDFQEVDLKPIPVE
jgi:hypothetical protein